MMGTLIRPLMAGLPVLLAACLCTIVAGRAADSLQLQLSPAHLTNRREVIDTALPTLVYRLTQHGTLDGDSTREPMGVRPPRQTWESNRTLTIENLDEIDLMNPWVSNGRTSFRTADDLVASVVRPGMTDEEKALAIWWKASSLRFHGDEHDDSQEPTYVFNAYGFNTCGGAATVLVKLWTLAGLAARLNLQPGHVVPEVFYGGAWHMLDGDLGAYYLLRDQQTVASHAQLVDDHDLVRRGHTGGVLVPYDPQVSRAASLYALGRLFGVSGRHLSHDDMHLIYWLKSYDKTRRILAVGQASMDLRLRPRESLSYRWQDSASPRYVGADFSGEGPAAVNLVTNGLLRYAPDFGRSNWRKGAVRVKDIEILGGTLVSGNGDGEVTWRIALPYPLLGAQVIVRGTGLTWEFSWDDKSWEPLQIEELDRQFAARSIRREYFLKVRLAHSSRLESFEVATTFQAARTSLPGLRLGQNHMAFTQDGHTHARIIHEWVETSAQRPPVVGALIAPLDGETVSLREMRFAWEGAFDADGDAIRDYHIEVSAFADMRWPVSPSHEWLGSRASGNGAAQEIQLPNCALFRHGKSYYWRVRAQDEHGVWGAWSSPRRFSVAMLEPPLNVIIDDTAKPDEIVLHWSANTEGLRPRRFEVHTSDQQGFSVGPETLWQVVDTSGVRLAGDVQAVRAYYRVVAVDAEGNRSLPSSEAGFPRPYIWTRPHIHLALGKKYYYQPTTVTSMGALRAFDPAQPGYWDDDRPVWSLLEGPGWLKYADGMLEGWGGEAGDFPVRLRVRTRTAGQVEQAFVISVGEAAGAPAVTSETEHLLPRAAEQLLEQFYFGAGDDNLPFTSLFAPEFIDRITRGQATPGFVSGALNDIRHRMQEYGPLASLSVVEVIGGEDRREVVVRLRYGTDKRIAYDRLTLVRSGAGVWQIGRAR